VSALVLGNVLDMKDISSFDLRSMNMLLCHLLYAISYVLSMCHMIRILCNYVLTGYCAKCNNGEGKGYSLGSGM